MIMNRGTIVLTVFPFTDLSSTKRRPAVVVSDTRFNDRDTTLAFISSKIDKANSDTDYILKSDSQDFISTGLKVSSVFKMNKLATLDNSLIIGEMGKASEPLMKQLDSKLKISLALESEK